MSAPAADGTRLWADAAVAAALFAVDPAGLGGIWLRALAGPVRQAWLDLLRNLLPPAVVMRRVPLHIADDRLLGGLDLAATLALGRPMVQRGLLAELDGGVAILAMAERMELGMAARLAATLDTGRVAIERDGVASNAPARLGMVALDEGATPDERPPAALCDRLAIRLDLAALAPRDAAARPHGAEEVAAARARLHAVTVDDDVIEALCAATLSLGIGSARAALLALRVARAAAALDGRDEVDTEDAALAARLVFAHRATALPAPPEEQEAPPEPPPPEDSADTPPDEQQQIPDGPLEDMVLAAAEAAIPADLLAQLQLAAGLPSRTASTGRVGQLRQSLRHGRPIGARRGELRAGARLHVIETLKAAAPWQRLRQDPAKPARLQVRRDDFRVVRFKQRIGTTTIFVVDASGSAALQRLAETKGAVELLLADAYVRRDKVALIAFRGITAELLLPPTNALARAKRSLAGLPGGGGTPLAAGIDAALSLADTVARSGHTPIITLLTDGRANIARDGTPGRPQAEADAIAAAGRLRLAGHTALLVDTSPRPHPAAQRLAAAMAARYLALPYADAAQVSRAVRLASDAAAVEVAA